VAPEAIGVEQRRRVLVFLQPRPQRFEETPIAGKLERHRLVFIETIGDELRQSHGVEQASATRPAKDLPARVSTGSPAHNASVVVTWPL